MSSSNPTVHRVVDHADADDGVDAEGARGASRTSTPGEIVQMITAIAAPTTLAASMLLFFGFTRTAHLYLMFGVDISSLDLSTQDYALRSVEAIFGPLVILLGISASLLWGHQHVRRLLRGGAPPRWVRPVAAVMLIFGGALLGRGVLGIVVPAVSRSELIMTPFALTAGTGLVAYGNWLRRKVTAAGGARWVVTRYLSGGIVVAIVLLGMLWATTNYAQAYGRATALEFITGVVPRPAVTVYSDDPLHIDHPLVDETRLDEGRRYRYDGLRLLTESNGDLYLFAEAVDASELTTFVVPTDGLRIDLQRG